MYKHKLEPGDVVTYVRPSWARRDLFDRATVVEIVNQPGLRGYVVEFGLGPTILPANRLRRIDS